MSKNRPFWILLVIIIPLAVFIFPRNALAYLDPSNGSYVLQVLAATFLGGLFTIKIFWQRIKNFFRKL